MNENAKLTGYVVSILLFGVFVCSIFATMNSIKENRLIQDLKDQNALLEQRALDYERQVSQHKEEFTMVQTKAEALAETKVRYIALVQKKATLVEEILNAKNA